MRWSAYLPLAATVTILNFSHLIHAAMPDSVPGEFLFPGNVNPLIYPAEARTAGQRAAYVRQLQDQVNGDASLSQADKDNALLRIKYAEADSQSLGNPVTDLRLTCTQAQYDEGLDVFRETMYLANYARSRIVATDDIFRQLFTDLLPKYKTSATGAATAQHVTDVFEATYALNAFLTTPQDAIAVAEGMSQVTNTRWIKFACPVKCDFADIAYVPHNTNVVHLCPKFFTSNNLKTIPRTEAQAKRELCEANSGVGIGSGTLFSSGVATMLHELQHSRYMKEQQPSGTSLFSDDHGYGISFWGGLGVKLVSMGKYKGSVVDLTPAQAKFNADTYAWYALLLVRRDLCKIRKIDKFDKMSCFRKFSLKLAKKGSTSTAGSAAASVNDHLEGQDPVPNAPPECSTDCGPSGTAKRSLDGRAAICCRPGTKPIEKKDPKTGKTTMDCIPETCPAGQIATQKKDPKTGKVTTTCSCPAGQKATQKKDPKTKKMVTTCSCPAGQTAVQKKDPKTGKVTVTCQPAKTAPTKCPAGQKRVQKKDAKTGKVTTVCAPATPPKTTPPKKTPPKKTPPKKTPPKKTPPKKTPPRRTTPRKKAGKRGYLN